jgi:uncharacterized protein YutE (UPF0331/DUF86 family)
MDKELIRNRLIDLEKLVKVLTKYREMRLETLIRNYHHILAMEHGLQISIQIILDIGNHILASVGENDISDYSDIIIKLGIRGILPKPFAEKIRPLAGLRNILVHEYIKVDLDELHGILKENLPDFATFSEHILTFIEK